MLSKIEITAGIPLVIIIAVFLFSGDPDITDTIRDWLAARS